MLGLETLLGAGLGGIFRLVPEVLKIFDRKDERKHELEMLKNQIKADKLRSDQDLREIEARGNYVISSKELDALITGVKSQFSHKVGIPWVDALSSLMRPLITIWWVLVLYTAAMVCQYVALWNNGNDWYEAVILVFGSDEKAISASIISYWFLDRTIRKGHTLCR